MEASIGQGNRENFSWENPIIMNDSERNIFQLRDPFILKEGQTWYMTGTLPPYDVGQGKSPKGIKGVPLYKSTDLKNWIFVDCIVKAPSESENKWYMERFWAPELFHHNGKYYVVVNCCCPVENDVDNLHGHLFAQADEIEGPYTVMNPEEPLCLGNDAHLFVDDDGQVYLFSSGIGIAKIDLDNLRLLTSREYPVTSIPGSTAWNGRRERVGFEGPCVHKYKGRYYLFYSTWARGYEVGMASSDSINGTWHMYSDPMYGAMDPKMCEEYGGIYEDDYYLAQNKYTQCGHNCVFEGPDGGIWIAAHCYDRINGGPGLVLDQLVFEESYGAKTVRTSDGALVNGPTWGISMVPCDAAAAHHTPVRALDVWAYASEAGRYTLPEQVDIRLENGFRVCAPVQWECVPDSDGKQEKISGIAFWEGTSYTVTAYLVKTDDSK